MLRASAIGDLTASAVKCIHFLALHHGGQNSWHI